jgi:hypothetical protein
VTPANASRKYLHAGIITLAISGTAAFYLNFEGVRCLTAIGRSDDNGVFSERELENASANCFIITNSYVYSLFGVVAGLIVVVFWAYKRRAEGNNQRPWKDR